MKITIKAARVNRAMTQAEAAKALHVSVKTLLEYEKGRMPVSFAMANLMAAVYKVPIDDLVFPDVPEKEEPHGDG